MFIAEPLQRAKASRLNKVQNETIREMFDFALRQNHGKGMEDLVWFYFNSVALLKTIMSKVPILKVARFLFKF